LYYWDIFTFLRNISLSVIIVFLDSSTSDGNYQQGLAALLVFLCSTALHFACLPYEVKELNYLEGVGLVVSMMTLYLGLWTFTTTWTWSSIIVSVLIFLINIIWLLCVLVVLSSAFGSKVKMIVTKLTSCFSKRGGVEGKAGMKNSNDVIIDVEFSHETKGGGRLKDDRFTSQEDGLEMGNLSKVLRKEGAKTKKKEKEKEKGDTLVVNPLLATKKMIK
jgi:hypothetical protein